jgi:predicted GNAT family acetyltransferase
MADIRILGPDDQPALEAFALPRVETSMFLLGNSRAAGLVDRGERLQGTYAAAFEGGAIAGVAAHFWNGNLVLQAPVHLSELWRAATVASARGLQGLIGPTAQVAAVMRELGVAPDADLVQMYASENLYTLALDGLIAPVALTLGAITARRGAERDLDVLTRWRADYVVEALNERESAALLQECRDAVERQIRAGQLWIAEAASRPVAMTGFNTTIREAVQVGGVYTPPELRGKGYARAVVAQSLLDARADGAGMAILFTGQDNIAAQKAYAALGFQYAGDYCLMRLFRSGDFSRSRQGATKVATTIRD